MAGKAVAYIRNLTVIVLYALGILAVSIILIPAHLIRWIAEHSMWIMVVIMGVALIGVWIWRSCTEPFG